MWCPFTKSSFLVLKTNLSTFNQVFFTLLTLFIRLLNRNRVLTNGLAARGHNLTVISGDLDKNPPNGVHYIHMDGLYSEFYNEVVKSAFLPPQSNVFEANIEFTDYMSFTCKGDRVTKLIANI